MRHRLGCRRIRGAGAGGEGQRHGPLVYADGVNLYHGLHEEGHHRQQYDPGRLGSPDPVPGASSLHSFKRLT